MPDNLQNNPWFQLGLVLALAAGMIYVGWNVWPNTVQMETMNKGIMDTNTALAKEVKEGLELEQRLPELEREIKAKEEELENLKKIIPSDREAEDLIRKLERMAAETNITVRSFQPEQQVAKEFYFEWPIAISASGSYHNVGKFFSKISNYARLINVTNVALRATKSTNPNQTLDASFKAVTYVYKDK
jgi:type IV pilus assembly protein PilO